MRGAISASRGAAAPSRHRRDSCPSDEVVGGLFFDFEAIRTEASDRDAPRRRHWLDRNQYRWHFRIAYFGLNVVLVGAMVLLYALIFFSGIDGVRYTYVALAGVSIAAPVAHCALYVTLSLQFAPFPLRGGDDEHRAHRSRVVVAWAFGRALWGLVVVTACSQIGTAAALRKDPQLGGVALAALFLFAEVCPFALTLDSGFLGLVDGDAVTTAPPSIYGTAPSPMRVESSGQFV